MFLLLAKSSHSFPPSPLCLLAAECHPYSDHLHSPPSCHPPPALSAPIGGMSRHRSGSDSGSGVCGVPASSGSGQPAPPGFYSIYSAMRLLMPARHAHPHLSSSHSGLCSQSHNSLPHPSFPHPASLPPFPALIHPPTYS